MVDVHDPVTRSRNMAAVRAVNTKPEMIVRRALHALGFRYRLHETRLPGTPDLVLRKFGALVFVHGCFWHGHDCHLFKWPKSRPDFWRAKIAGNMENDAKSLAALRSSGWRVGIVWECALKGRARRELHETMQLLATWVRSENDSISIGGKRDWSHHSRN